MTQKANHAVFGVVEETAEHILIRDVGPWHIYKTITNDAEGVCETLAPMLQGRRLEYLDSEGNRDQLLVKDGKFAGFHPTQTGESNEG
jgi:hypothetical protein